MHSSLNSHNLVSKLGPQKPVLTAVELVLLRTNETCSYYNQKITQLG